MTYKITKDEALKIGDKILDVTRQNKMSWLTGDLSRLIKEFLGIHFCGYYKGFYITLEETLIEEGKKFLFFTIKEPKTELCFFIYEDFNINEKPIGCIENQTFVKNLLEAINEYFRWKRFEEIKKRNKKIEEFINED